jgi:hypothetical protein
LPRSSSCASEAANGTSTCATDGEDDDEPAPLEQVAERQHEDQSEDVAELADGHDQASGRAVQVQIGL